MLNDSSTVLAFEDCDVSGTGVEVSNVEQNGTTITLSCKAMEDACLTVPIFAYDYYRCIDVETKAVYPCLRGENNKINVVLPAGYQGTLRISFVEPWYWRAAEVVSIITLAWMLIYCRRRRLKSLARKSLEL